MSATRRCSIYLASIAIATTGCGGDERRAPPPVDDTTLVGTFDGLFDDVVTGFNFPLDIALVPADPMRSVGLLEGDILIADYGTSRVMLAADAASGGTAEVFYDGAEAGLRGATAVALAPDRTVWASFEQGGEGDHGGIVVLSPTGDRLALLDDADEPGAFARPGGICFGDLLEPDGAALFFYVNMEDGTAWRIDAAGTAGEDFVLTEVGGGLATGTAGDPGTAPDGIGSNQLPMDGARGCAYGAGHLYVADAQNARIVRFDDADVSEGIAATALEDAPADLVTYPTGVTINSEGALIVISYDNAHAFVALESPSGGFIDNGLHELNVNSGNYGTQVAQDTIWFTRANNKNGALRAITRDADHPPSALGPFPVQ